jgi:mono/diheme cytochrome c family protein
MKLLSCFLIATILALNSFGANLPRRRSVRSVPHHNVVKQNVVVNELVIERKVVEFDEYGAVRVVAIPVTDYGPEYYWKYDGDSEELRNYRISDEDIERIKKAVIDEYARRYPSQNPVEGEPIPEPPVSDASDLDKKIEVLFIRECSSCHSDNNPKGGLTLINQVGGLSILAENIGHKTRWNVYDRTHGGGHLDPELIMPLNKERLSDEDIDLIHEWARQGE